MLHVQTLQAGVDRRFGRRPAAMQFCAMNPTRLRRGFGAQVSSEESFPLSMRTAKAQRRKDCRRRMIGADFQPALLPLDRQPEMQIRAIDPMPSEE
jgi:hypothetical protein